MNLPHFTEQLRSTVLTLRGLLASVSPEQADWRPTPERWSILDVVNHLADEERVDFRQRLDLTLNHPEKEWPGIDPENAVRDARYRERSLAEAMEDFAAERERSLEWLATLDAPDWEAAHTHPVFGSIQAGTLMVSWVGHDLLHLRQIIRLQWDYLESGVGSFTTKYAGEW